MRMYSGESVKQSMHTVYVLLLLSIVNVGITLFFAVFLILLQRKSYYLANYPDHVRNIWRIVFVQVSLVLIAFMTGYIAYFHHSSELFISVEPLLPILLLIWIALWINSCFRAMQGISALKEPKPLSKSIRGEYWRKNWSKV